MSRISRLKPVQRTLVKATAWLLVIGLALMAIVLPEIDPTYFLDAKQTQPLKLSKEEILELRFLSNVKNVLALQQHRAKARQCAGAVRDQAPEIVSSGNPTMIFIEGPLCDAKCAWRLRSADGVYARYRDRGLNGIWVDAGTPASARQSSLRRVEAPACVSLTSERNPAEWLVLDKTGNLFFGGNEENDLKARLWVRDPDYQPTPNLYLGGQGVSLLLQSGTPYFEEEAVLITTWARRCKWYFAQCFFVDGQHRAVRRLDGTSAEELVRAGEAEAERLNFYRGP